MCSIKCGGNQVFSQNIKQAPPLLSDITQGDMWLNYEYGISNYYEGHWRGQEYPFFILPFPQGSYKIKAIFLPQVWCICHLNYNEILENVLEKPANYCYTPSLYIFMSN